MLWLLILVLIFTLWLGWLPGGGWEGGKIQFVIMPVIALSTSYMASIARLTRSSMLEVLNSNFIRTARAKGIPKYKIIFAHAFKPTLLPVISYLGPAFVGMITGSVVIDMYFSTGGIGLHFVNGALNRDYSKSSLKKPTAIKIIPYPNPLPNPSKMISKVHFALQKPQLVP